MTPQLWDLLALISRYPNSATVANPWSTHTLGAFERVDRLVKHFDCKPRFLLIGEAPGYQGCRLTGVPFTSERLIMDGKVPRVTYDKSGSGPFKDNKPKAEPSATIVWGILHELGIADCTVMWNAFAFHPHNPGDRFSNRAPTRTEVQENSQILQAVHSYFVDAKLIAVGKVAAKALTSVGVGPAYIARHPSMGGATQFREEMRCLIS